MEVSSEPGYVEVRNHGVIFARDTHRYVFAILISTLQESDDVLRFLSVKTDILKVVVLSPEIGAVSRALFSITQIQASCVIATNPRATTIKCKSQIASHGAGNTDVWFVVEPLIGIVVSSQAHKRIV